MAGGGARRRDAATPPDCGAGAGSVSVASARPALRPCRRSIRRQGPGAAGFSDNRTRGINDAKDNPVRRSGVLGRRRREPHRERRPRRRPDGRWPRSALEDVALGQAPGLHRGCGVRVRPGRRAHRRQVHHQALLRPAALQEQGEPRRDLARGVRSRDLLRRLPPGQERAAQRARPAVPPSRRLRGDAQGARRDIQPPVGARGALEVERIHLHVQHPAPVRVHGSGRPAAVRRRFRGQAPAGTRRDGPGREDDRSHPVHHAGVGDLHRAPARDRGRHRLPILPTPSPPTSSTRSRTG